MQDIYGLTDLVAGKIRSGMYRNVSTSRSAETFVSRTFAYDNAFPQHHDFEYEYKIRAKARYKISDPALKALAQMGITNPHLLVWELIPYSFVFDWIFPVGDFLSSIDAMNGTSNLTVVRSVYHREIEKLWVAGQLGGQSVYSETFRSGPTTSLAVPSLAYKPSKSVLALLNGMALLRQLRRGH